MTKQEMIDILRGKTQYTGRRWKQAQDVQRDLNEIADYLEAAVPVVHGHWEFGCGGSYNGILQVDLWDCSRCGESCGYKSKYCPSCGARMDEKDGDQDDKQ